MGVEEDSVRVLEEYLRDVVGGEALVRVAVDDDVGRHLVATCDLQPGQVIARETRVVSAPQSEGLCVMCLERSAGDLGCPRCGWPVCDICAAEDPDSKSLHEECSILAPLRERRPWKNWRAPGAVLGVLRCLLLRDKRPDLWPVVDCLQDNVPSLGRTPWLAACLENIVSPIQTDLGMDVPVKTLVHIAGVLDTNSFAVSAPEGLSARALYPLLCLMAHECAPNSNRFFDAGVTTLVATRPIRAGARVTTSYTSLLWGTDARRAHLAATKFFHCTCRRCEDPTELGSLVTALACRAGPDGPGSSSATSSPSASTANENAANNGAINGSGNRIGNGINGGAVCNGNNTDGKCNGMRTCRGSGDDCFWECDRCGRRMPAARVHVLHQMLALTLGKTLGKREVARAERWAEAHQEVLGPNHHFLLEVRLLLVDLYAERKEGDLTENQKRRQELCKNLLEIADKLEPGPTRLRGKLLCHLAESSLLPEDGNKESQGCIWKMAKEAAEILQYDGLLRPMAERVLKMTQNHQLAA